MAHFFAPDLETYINNQNFKLYITYYDNSCVSSFITQIDPFPINLIDKVIQEKILCSCFPMEHQCLLIFHKEPEIYYKILKFFKKYYEKKMSRDEDLDFYDSFISFITSNGGNIEEEYHDKILAYFDKYIL